MNFSKEDENYIYNVIGRNIKKYRKLKHMSQRQLAIKSGYSYSYIKKLENEKEYKTFSLQTIDNINTKGQVEVGGQIWTARSSSDQIVIEQDELVEILEISPQH